MSELKIITKESDIDDLEFGDSFIIKIPGLPDDPIELFESDEWAEAERLQKLIEIKFSDSKEEPPPPPPAKEVSATVELGPDSITSLVVNETEKLVKVHTRIDPGRDRSNTIAPGKTKKSKFKNLKEDTFIEIRLTNNEGPVLASTKFIYLDS